MTVEYKVHSFPAFPISKQLFHVPGAAADGGFTSGGARILAPEPGGFSQLEIQPALQLGEWRYPLSSWLMSKTNGQIIRVRLAPTPQIASLRTYGLSGGVPWDISGIYPESPWNNLQNWEGDLTTQYAVPSPAGSNEVTLNMATLGDVLQVGHVIGHKNSTYLVDEIEYGAAGAARVTVTPPLRDAVAAGDPVYFRPWFTGYIANGADFRTTYDASLVGMIQLNTIVLNEVILP